MKPKVMSEETSADYNKHKKKHLAERRLPKVSDSVPIKLTIVRREQWCDIPPKWEKPVFHPVPYVLCTFTRKQHCFTEKDCYKELKYLQMRHTKFGSSPDINFNFLIGGNGLVYEGRGWSRIPTLPKRHRFLETRCIAIAMFGTFTYNPPSQLMKTVQNMLIRYGMENGYIQMKISQFTT